MTPLLRPYQQDAVDALERAFEEHLRVLFVGPTGMGKTVLFSYITAGAASNGCRVCIAVHRRELVDQVSASLERFCVDHGIVAAGYPQQAWKRVQVMSIQTVIRRLNKFEPFDLVVLDEAHHAVSQSYTKFLLHHSGRQILGVTATPCRLDGKGLGHIFETMVLGPTPADLIQTGYLSPYELYAPSDVDLSGVHRRGGDYAKEELAAAMDKPKIIGCAIEHYELLGRDKQAIGFAVTVEAAQKLAAQFRERGHTAEAIYGDMPADDRRAMVERFRQGETKLLWNCDLVGEGFDVPGDGLANIILLRPTQSLSLYLQQCGRGLRPGEGKVCRILDHVGNWRRHGLPDQPREWSLDEGVKKKRATRDTDEPELTLRQCKQCAAVHKWARTCPRCGYVYPVIGRQVQQVDGALELVTAEEVYRLAPEIAAQVERRRTALRYLQYKGKLKWNPHALEAIVAKYERELLTKFANQHGVKVVNA